MYSFFEQHKVILAPMAGVNDPVFRDICIDCGASLTYSEMISSMGLNYANAKTKGLLDLGQLENKLVVQLFGHDPYVMAAQASYIFNRLGQKLAYIDINMGCPMRKITKKGDGSALMDSPRIASKIVSHVSSVCKVTVKVRKHKNLVEFAKLMQESGASAICVHGRTAGQMYKGEADWDCVDLVKNSLSIPVIGSGDINCLSQAYQYIDSGLCDAVMIGRAARGNPWVFSNIEPSIKTRIKTALFHVRQYNRLHEGRLSHMKKHCMWYLKGLPAANWARSKLNYAKTLEDYEKILMDERLLGYHLMKV